MPRSHRDRSSSSHSGHHHHRSRSRSRSRRIFRLKHKERNFLAAVCSMFVIVTMATALAEPKWFTVKGGGCNTKTLGVYQFFYPGTFYIDTESNVVYHYGHGLHDVLIDCVDHRTVQIIWGIIVLTFVGILFSLIAFILDLFGPSERFLKGLRRNGVGNIATVCICVTINGLCYWITTLVEHIQKATKIHKGSKVEVRFALSFYLIAFAGGLSVIASAWNLLRRYPPYEVSEHREHLLDDYDGVDFVPSPPSSAAAAMPLPSGPPPSGPTPPAPTAAELVSPTAQMPPPPAYTP